MTRYYLYAQLIDDVETYSLKDSPVELQFGEGINHFYPGLWVPKPKVFFLKSLNKEVAINWKSDIYNLFFCDFEFGDEAFKEYVEKLFHNVLQYQRPIKYVISKELC